MRSDILTALNDERAARRAAILVTDIADGAQRLVRESDLAVDPLADVLAKHLASGKSGLVEADGRTLFLTVQVPPVRLVVVGAVHISQAMAPMAAGLRRPTMMVSTIDIAIHPSSESTTGMASSNRAPSSLRKRVVDSDCVTGACESMVLFTLTDLEQHSGLWIQPLLMAISRW